ncbi:MAG TPA: ABC transporter permease [Ignavibacteria bacterium]|nr:ABC transporter permease [Ignavibacteria bacterium]
MQELLTITFVLQTLRITIPYLLPSMGAVYSEKGGVVNIALEGILLSGAFAAAAGTYYTGNVLFGIFCGVIAGILISLIHSIITITFKANQIVSGIALNIFAFGITKFFCKILFGSSSNSERIPGLETLNLPFNLFLLITAAILALTYFVVHKTRFGLRLRAVGENPEAADSLGINVNRVRYIGVLISGALGGLGGAWLAMDQHSFTDGMSAGRGYIALAAMIIGKWNPLGAAAACLLFGLAESFTLQFQDSGIPTQFIQVLPYILTIVVLAGFIGKANPPAADGIPFQKKD